VAGASDPQMQTLVAERVAAGNPEREDSPTYLLKRLKLDDRISYLPKPLFRKPYLMCFARHSDYPGLEGIMTNFYAELRKMRLLLESVL
jgi:hypothetical protein